MKICFWKYYGFFLIKTSPNSNKFVFHTDMMSQRRAGLGFCERLPTQREPPFCQCASTLCVLPSYSKTVGAKQLLDNIKFELR